jgi:ribose transport system permease protein
MARKDFVLLALRLAPVLLFAIVVLVFGLMSERFLSIANFRNILIQAAPIAILAIGMTYVLLIAEIDLSVGAVMYLTASVIALYLTALPWGLSLLLILLAAAGAGALNALVVTTLGVASFIVTLASLFILRGIAMFLSNTKTLPFPREIRDLNRADLLGIPFAITVLIVVVAIAFAVLNYTAFGRQVFAVGGDREVAKKAGLPIKRIMFACFVISGLCAGIGGFLSATQQGAVGPKFGDQIEFQAIAAAVLGGVSLFGGRGSVFGPIFGAILIRTTIAGLTFINADPYIYPLVTAVIIFLAVAVDGIRTQVMERLDRRNIRPVEAPGIAST